MSLHIGIKIAFIIIFIMIMISISFFILAFYILGHKKNKEEEDTAYRYLILSQLFIYTFTPYMCYIIATL